MCLPVVFGLIVLVFWPEHTVIADFGIFFGVLLRCVA